MSTSHQGQSRDGIDTPSLSMPGAAKGNGPPLMLPTTRGVDAISGSGMEASGDGRRGKRGGEMGAPPSFLDKLCDILNDEKLSRHIAWNQSGDGIVIGKVERFAAEVLPKYYKHSNYQSFVRQLNIYGFHKTRHDETSCEFKHPHFRRGQRHLLSLIRRKSQTSNSAKHREENANAATEAKGIFDRVATELRHFCNRLSAIEAELGMVNQRYDTLLRESTALWRTVLDGDAPLRQKALAAIRQLSLSSSELDLYHQNLEETNTEQPSLPLSTSGPVHTQPSPRESPVTWAWPSSLRNSSSLPQTQRQPSARSQPPYSHQRSLSKPPTASTDGGSRTLRPPEPLEASNVTDRVVHVNSNNSYSTLPSTTADQLVSDTLLSLAGMSPSPMSYSSVPNPANLAQEEGGTATRSVRRRAAPAQPPRQPNSWPAKSMQSNISVVNSRGGASRSGDDSTEQGVTGGSLAAGERGQGDNAPGGRASGAASDGPGREARSAAVDEANRDRRGGGGALGHGRSSRTSASSATSSAQARGDFARGAADDEGASGRGAMVLSGEAFRGENALGLPSDSTRRSMMASSPMSPLPSAASGGGSSRARCSDRQGQDRINTPHSSQVATAGRNNCATATTSRGEALPLRGGTSSDSFQTVQGAGRYKSGRNGPDAGSVVSREGLNGEDHYKRPLEKSQMSEQGCEAESRRRRTKSS